MKLTQYWLNSVVLAAVLAVAFLVSAGHPLAAAELAAETADGADLFDTDIRDFRVNLLALFNAGSYPELDAIAEHALQQRSRFTGGAWHLHVFYSTLSTPGSATATDAAWAAHIAKLQHWAVSSPTSAAPCIAVAQTDLRFAWKARGHGNSDTVTPEGAALFLQRAAAARSTLEQCAAIGASSPQWFLQMQNVALDQQWQRAATEALVERATALEPLYQYVAIAHSNYLLPKWYGHAGDTEAFAAQVADRIGGAAGDALYFEVAADINCCKRAQAPALSWPRVQRGFAALETLYRSTNHERNVMAYLAVQSGDFATAQQLFARIGNDWSEAVWKSKPAFDTARLRATDPGLARANP